MHELESKNCYKIGYVSKLMAIKNSSEKKNWMSSRRVGTWHWNNQINTWVSSKLINNSIAWQMTNANKDRDIQLIIQSVFILSVFFLTMSANVVSVSTSVTKRNENRLWNSCMLRPPLSIYYIVLWTRKSEKQEPFLVREAKKKKKRKKEPARRIFAERRAQFELCW